jgi:broad specificity phosphatase PhoE
LRETNYGEVEGKKSADIGKEEKYIQICKAVDAGDNDAHFPGGESRNMVVQRFKDFLHSVPTDDNILISAHGGILRSFSCLCGGEDKKIPNCGGVRFSLNEQHLQENIVLFE